MSHLMVAVLALAVGPEEGVASHESIAAVQATRSGYELRDAVRVALRRWARPASGESERAARDFQALYGELQHDEKLAQASRSALLSKVAGRLAKLERRPSSTSARPTSVRFPDNRRTAHAQIGGFVAGPMAGQKGRGGQSVNNGQELVELIQRTIRPMTWDVNGGHGAIVFW